MFEVTYTINGVEGSKNVRCETEEQAVAKILEDMPDACIVRVVGPWKLS